MFLVWNIQAQYTISGKITADKKKVLDGASISIANTTLGAISDANGNFSIRDIPTGSYEISASFIGATTQTKTVEITDRDTRVDFQLELTAQNLSAVIVKDKTAKTTGITRLRAVEGVGIYASKKTEVVVLGDITANLATNVSRQVYSKVVGLNIWESDGAGVQLGIGGRGPWAILKVITHHPPKQSRKLKLSEERPLCNLEPNLAEC